MKKNPIKEFKYECPMYDMRVTLVVCGVDEVEAWSKKKFGGVLTIGPQQLALTAYYDDVDYDNPVVIWMSPGCGVRELVHECFHAARHYLLKHGVYTGPEDEAQESMAYLLDHMFGSLYNQWAKSTHKKVDMS